MNHNTEEVKSQRVSNTSCADVSPSEAIENKPAEQGKNKPELENKDVSEQKAITKDENNHAIEVLRKSLIQEYIEHNEYNTSPEPKNDNEIQVVDIENDDNNEIINDEREQKRAACCGCFVDVCYCMTWYCEIMRNSIVRCFNNLSHLCGRNRKNTSEESDGNYFYSGLNDTFNNQSGGDNVGNVVLAEEATATIATDRSVTAGNDGGHDKRAVDKVGGTDDEDTCDNMKNNI